MSEKHFTGRSQRFWWAVAGSTPDAPTATFSSPVLTHPSFLLLLFSYQNECPSYRSSLSVYLRELSQTSSTILLTENLTETFDYEAFARPHL